MPCDSILAAFPQRFVPSRCAPAAPWPSPSRLAGLPPDLRQISRGEKIPHGGGPAVFPATAKTSTGRGEGARNPAGAGLSLRAPKRPPFSAEISVAEAICFCSFPPQSCGSGNCGTGSGPRPLPSSGCRAGRTHGTTAPEGAAHCAASSSPASRTSSARPAPPGSVPWASAGALRSTRRAPADSSPGINTVSAALLPRAITSG